MAITYSSWEYSQGPILYIDSSGFESIDEDKNFVFFYVVTYGPVEYKRKATDEKGESIYEYKYSFGSDNSARKVLDKFTFTGKHQLTKTVTHSVTEEGFKKDITKTFIIDTDMESNLNSNPQLDIKPSSMVQIINWRFYTTGVIAIPKFFINGIPRGWHTMQKTGYRQEAYTSYNSYAEWLFIETIPGWFYPDKADLDGWMYYTGDDGTSFRTNRRGDIYKKIFKRHPHTCYKTVPYIYHETYNSYGELNLKEVRNKIGDYKDLSSVSIVIRTKSKINGIPKLSVDDEFSPSERRNALTCKISGVIPAENIIEYHLPIEYIYETFKDKDRLYIFLEKDKCSHADLYFFESYAYIQTNMDKAYYINLMVQAYDASTDTWNTCCVVPYLNHEEITTMKANRQYVSKNLFLPSDLPKTDANYRIQLDTNLLANEAERLTNFRIDVLSDQLIPPGSIEDRKLYINNDSLEFENEIEVDDINEIKLNVLGFSTHTKIPYAGFLRQGANDIHTYLKNSVFAIEEGVLEENISKNVFYSFISKTNGNWVSNNMFVANTFEIGTISILDSINMEDDLIEFRIPYNALKSYSSYTFMFNAYVDECFTITDIYTIDVKDQENILKGKLYAELDSDESKVYMEKSEYIFYSPPYKLKNQSNSELVSEYDLTNRNVTVRIELNTKNINPNDSSIMVLKIKRTGVKNVFIKGLQCLCIDENDERYLDITEPYNVDIYTGRQYDTFMTLYYDGFNLSHINPLLYKDMVYLRNELNKIRNEYTLQPYPWSDWENKYDQAGNLITDDFGHGHGVNVDQPIRAVHFNDVKNCCVQTYEDLLALKPPVGLNTSPTQFREGTGLIPLIENDPSQGYILQHVKDRDGNAMDIDKYFPEWRQIIDLINRN